MTAIILCQDKETIVNFDNVIFIRANYLNGPRTHRKDSCLHT